MNKIIRFLSRILHGEDVIMVRQSKDAWEHQFEDGKWDRLVSGQQNTELLAKLLLEQRHDGGIIRVLDVGCGNGGLAQLVAKDSRVDYVGIDISEAAISKARTIVPSGKFVVADAEYPPSDIGTFDILVFNEVFFYVDPTIALPNYRTHAASNARILVSVVRSWRTLFVFWRVQKYVRVEKRMKVSDGRNTWDVIEGRFI